MSNNTYIVAAVGMAVGGLATFAVSKLLANKKPLQKHPIQKFENDTKAGMIYRGNHLNIVRKVLSPQGTIAPHAHPGKQIVLTLIRGSIDVFHDNNHEILDKPGALVTFFGDRKVNMIAGDNGAEFIVCLVNL